MATNYSQETHLRVTVKEIHYIYFSTMWSLQYQPIPSFSIYLICGKLPSL
jgi:hypothetical protein